jgi:hypothetical protein
MKHKTIALAILVSLGATTTAFAGELKLQPYFQTISAFLPGMDAGSGKGSFYTTVGCNPNDQDKQGQCMSACKSDYLNCVGQYDKTKEGCQKIKTQCESACGC